KEVWRASDSPGRARTPSRDRIASTRAGGSTCVISMDRRNDGARTHERQELVRRAVDVARAEGQHDVARTDDLEQRVRDPLAGRHVADVEMPPPTKRLIEPLGRDPLEPL